MPGHDGAQAVPARAVCVTVLDFEIAAEPETGLWCDTCLLPSAVALSGVVTLNAKPAMLRTFVVCPECEQVVG